MRKMETIKKTEKELLKLKIYKMKNKLDEINAIEYYRRGKN